MASDTSIIVTAYNEAERIGATLAALATAFPDARVLLADDGSQDGTAEIARREGALVVRSAQVIGKGGAATLAARVVLADVLADAGGEGPLALPIVLLCDGDLGESAGELVALVEAIRDGRADITVAAFARRVGGGVGMARMFARWAIRRRCGLLTTAPISGQRALSARALTDVLPFARGFGMEIGMTIDAVRCGHRVVELELDLSHRATGRTLAGFAHRARQLADFVRVYLLKG